MTERTSSSKLEFPPTLNFKSLAKDRNLCRGIDFSAFISHTNDSSDNGPHVLSYCFLLLGIAVNIFLHLLFYLRFTTGLSNSVPTSHLLLMDLEILNSLFWVVQLVTESSLTVCSLI